MQDEQRQILQMVQDGTITAEQAEQLLAALETDAPETDVTITQGDQIHYIETEPFRRYWEVPFWIGVVGAVVMMSCALTVPWGFISFCGWSLFTLALLLIGIGWWSREARWVHVNIQEEDGDKFKISLPLPLNLVSWGMGFARRFVDDEMASNLSTAASLISTLAMMPEDEPMMIEVDDEDGDHVQIYIA
jgi:hypothetical protein